MTYHHLLSETHQDSLVVVPSKIDPDEVIEHGMKLGFISALDDKVGPLIKLNDGQANALTYFRNNIQHLLAVPALIAAAFTNCAERSDSALRKLISLSLPYQQAELFLADQSDELINKSLNALQSRNLLHRVDDYWRRAPAGSIEAVSLIQLAQVIMPSLERGYLTASLIARASNGRISRTELSTRCQYSAERLAHIHERDATDLYDKHLLGIFVSTLTQHGLLEIEDDDLVATEALLAMEDDARTLLGESIRHAIISAATACSAARTAGN